MIDDQIHVVDGILSEVDWDGLGIETVWKAYSAAEAKGILLLNQVDIMLCDIEMPGENGLSLLKWTLDQGCLLYTSGSAGFLDFSSLSWGVKAGKTS